MIVDKIENADLYANLSKNIARALEILKDPTLPNKDPGKHDVDGDNLYYIVARYSTKPLNEGQLEAHKKYIDIQFVAEGQELLGYVPVSDTLKVEKTYSPDDDAALYKIPEQVSTVRLTKGMFCILLPQDAHVPGRQADGPSDVHKVVVKVKLNA